MGKVYDLMIIGGGPAGITAGIYAVRKNIDTLMLVKPFEVGGQLIKNTWIENYPGFPGIAGYDLAQVLKEHAAKLNVMIKEEEAVSINRNGGIFKISTSEGKIYDCLSLIIATGLEPKKTGAKGEEILTGNGVSYCSTCDAPLYKDKAVGVYGNGIEAVNTVLHLIPIAKKIYFLVNAASLKASGKTIEELNQNPKIGLFYNAEVSQFYGKERLESILIKLAGKTKKFDISGFFVNIGYSPAVSFLKGVPRTNDKKEISVDEENKTDIPGIFAAGDCTSYPFKQAIIAAAQGAAAALSSSRYLLDLKYK